MGCAGDAGDAADTGANADDGPEPLLSVHAMVLSAALPLSPELVPALTFTPFVMNWGHTEFIVTGEHAGDLLSQFSLRLYDEPPAEAMSVMMTNEPAIALGAITAVAPNHPNRLDWTRGDNDEILVCGDDGECGVPARQACGPHEARTCLGTIVPGKDWGNHGIDARYLVVYLSGPAAAGGVYSQFFAQGKPMRAGYTLVKMENLWYTLDERARAEQRDCLERASTAALANFNADHGTDYTDPTMVSQGGSQRDVQVLADWDGALISATVTERCIVPGSQQLMPPTSDSAPLRLVLADWN